MYELTIELRSDTGRCLYEQIYDHIKQEIRVGRLSVGERLPSTRSLAEYLQVSRTALSYRMEQLGLLDNNRLIIEAEARRKGVA